MCFQLAADARLALAPVEDDEIFEQPRLVVFEGLDLDGTTRAAARRQKPMAVGLRTRTDVLNVRSLRDFRAANDERYDASAVHEHEPADRPRKHELAFAVFQVRIPAHLFWKCQVAQQRTHHVREHVHCRFAALSHSIREIGALGRFVTFERADLDTIFLGEAGRRGRRRSIGRICGRDWRACDQVLEIGLTFVDSGDANRQTPWSAVALHGSAGGQTKFLETGLQLSGKLRGEIRQPAGRDLFASDFNQELPVHL